MIMKNHIETESDRIERELAEKLGRKPSLQEINNELRKHLDAKISMKVTEE